MSTKNSFRFAFCAVPVFALLTLAEATAETWTDNTGKFTIEAEFQGVSGKSIVLLVGGLLIGWAAGPDGISSIEPFFFDLFKGVLALFLLEMGLIAASQTRALRESGLFLTLFGTLVPIPMATIGAIIGWAIGLSVGGTTLLAVLAGSASYIAAPAAIRIAVPEANPTVSLTASLGVTFPFNIFIGIPAYFAIANFLHGIGG